MFQHFDIPKEVKDSFINNISSILIPIVSYSANGQIIFVNNYFLNITGFKRDEVINRNWYGLFVPTDKRDTAEQTTKLVIEKKINLNSESPVITHSGKKMIFEWHNFPLYDSLGLVKGVVSVGFDITARTNIEKELKFSEEKAKEHSAELQEKNASLEETKRGMLNLLDDARRLEQELQAEKRSVERKVVERTNELNQEQARLLSSINSVPDGFIVTDRQNKIVFTNRSLFHIFENLPQKPSLEDVSKLLPDEVNFSSTVQNIKKEKKAFNFRNIETNKKILEMYVSPIFISEIDTEAIGLIILFSDVTEQKIIEKSKDEFFAIASHELRTPITAIRGNVEMIQKYYSTKINDTNFNEMLEDMHTSSTRLIQLVNEFLKTSRVEQGKITFNIGPFDLNQLIEKTISEYSAITREKDLYLNYKMSKTSIVVKADKERVKEVLDNLIGNAVMHTQKGGIDILLELGEGIVKVYVKDSGSGISEQNQRLLFRKFQQVTDDVYSRDMPSSTGLGLYISKLLLESMGGTISLSESKPGIGSTFVFTLPLTKI